MIKLSNSHLLSLLSKLLVILVITKALSLALLWYLPSDGVELSVQENYKPKYQRVDFKNMIHNSKAVAQKTTKTAVTSVSITNMVLKGLYGTKSRGFVIVARKSSPKVTTIVEVGEEYLGFRLKSIIPNGAVFTKGGKEYILELEKLKLQKSFINRVEKKSSSNSVKNVSRSDITYYSKNPTKIWKEISIRPLKNGRKLKGFKVTKVVRGSKMAELGLQKNDVIIRANNIELNSLKSVTDLYSNMSNINAIELVVLRNNQEKELVYEIN